MTTVTLRMRNCCMQIDEHNFIIPGLMRISSDQGNNNGIYLESNIGPLIDDKGYSLINIIDINPKTELKLGNIVKNIDFTISNSTLPGIECAGQKCLMNDKISVSPMHFEACVSDKGSIIGGPTCDVTIFNPDNNIIKTYLPTFGLVRNENNKEIVLWDNTDGKFVDFTGFPIDLLDSIYSLDLQNNGIYAKCYFSSFNSSNPSKEFFSTPFTSPYNLTNEVNDMANSTQTNPMPICDLLPSGI